jgi:hypothetical protein
MNSPNLVESNVQEPLPDMLADLKQQMTDLSRALTSLAGRARQCQCQPFMCDGRIRFMVTAEELSIFIPRSPGTLLEWAAAGKIPARKLPPTKAGGAHQWMFDVPEVMREMDGYRIN